ncbi:MAG: hypothetical protein LBG72_05255 [Spirochaetaceae bacterium]|jgi:hypothetical protein|nr:hypothetical protein [Spirochaetaceae bacterium]
MKMRFPPVFFICAAVFIFWGGCGDIELPNPPSSPAGGTGEGKVYLTPGFKYSPAGEAGPEYDINVNPNGILIASANLDSSGTYNIELEGNIKSGIPIGLRRFKRANPKFDNNNTASGDKYYRFGDYDVQVYPDRTYDPDPFVPNPNYTPHIKVPESGNAKFTAVTISGILQAKDKKGNQRDLYNISIKQKNEALKYYNSSNTSGTGWTNTIDTESGTMVTQYAVSNGLQQHPYNFLGTTIQRGGISDNSETGGLSLLLWDGASSKTVDFTITYKDGGITKAHIDYSKVTINDNPPSIVWLYSDYSPHLPPTAPDYQYQFPRIFPYDVLTADNSRVDDPSAKLITGEYLKAPYYNAQGGGPFPYDPKDGLRAKAGTSEVYICNSLTIGSTLRLLPVFYPLDSFSSVLWDPADNKDDTSRTYAITENPDGSLSIMNISGSSTINVTATIKVNSSTKPSAADSDTMILKAQVVLVNTPTTP